MIDEDGRMRFLVMGRVQGVGFRWWTKETADALGVTGFVRNRPDGSVEVRAIGDPQSLREMERMLHQGPRFARVDEVRVLQPDDAAGATGTVDRGSGSAFVILG